MAIYVKWASTFSQFGNKMWEKNVSRVIQMVQNLWRLDKMYVKLVVKGVFCKTIQNGGRYVWSEMGGAYMDK